MSQSILVILSFILCSIFVCSFNLEYAASFDWEYAAIYDFEGSEYTLKVNNSLYDEPEFHFLALITDDDDEHGLEEVEELAESDWDGLYMSTGNKLSLHQNLMIYLEIDEDETESTLSFDFHEPAIYAFFFEHSPDEVPFGIYDDSNNIVPPSFEEESGHEHSESESTTSTTEDDKVTVSSSTWGLAITASVITSALSMTGLLLVVFLRTDDVKSKFLQFAHSFGSGALLAASMIHLIPESYAFLEEFEDAEEVGWKAGSVILAGLLLSMLIHAKFSTHEHGVEEGPPDMLALPSTLNPRVSDTTYDETDLDTSMDISKDQSLALSVKSLARWFPNRGSESKSKSQKVALFQPVAWNIFMGDLIHNFLDGVLIASAFASCGATSGWTILAAVAAHEIPQEIADFFILIKSGLTSCQAVLFNFASGFASVIGAITLLSAVESLTKHHLGYLLLGGSGIFIFIGCCELLPEVMKNAHKKVFILHLFVFILGMVVVSLPLLNHVVCEEGNFGHDHAAHASEETETSHAGHDH